MVTSAPPTQTTPPTPPTSTQGAPIKWNIGGQDKCLTVAGGVLTDGAALKMYVSLFCSVTGNQKTDKTGLHSADCFPSNSPFYYLQQFVYNQGRTKIRVAPNKIYQTDYCVDFGSNRGVNGQPGKIWACYEGLPAQVCRHSCPIIHTSKYQPLTNRSTQALWITGDNHIAVEGDNQCLDVRDDSQPSQGPFYGSLKDVQSWQCFGGNTNQASRLGHRPRIKLIAYIARRSSNSDAWSPSRHERSVGMRTSGTPPHDEQRTITE